MSNWNRQTEQQELGSSAGVEGSSLHSDVVGTAPGSAEEETHTQGFTHSGVVYVTHREMLVLNYRKTMRKNVHQYVLQHSLSCLNMDLKDVYCSDVFKRINHCFSAAIEKCISLDC